MKTKTCFLIMFLFGSFLYAQDFSTKFYLTDKHGAKDTLEIGYSGNATFGLDSQYGEVGYSTPVNINRFGASIIISETAKDLSEIMRNQEISTFSKKQIVPFNQTAWIEQNAIGIMVPANSLPVTVSWDKSQFSDMQRNYSFITDWRIGGWFDAGGASFKENLKDTESIQINDSATNYVYLDGLYIYSDGTNEYPMYLFYVAFANYETIMNGVENVNGYQMSDFLVVRDGCVEFKNNINIRSVSVYNTLGELVFHNSSNQTSKINIGDYKKGVYFLYLVTDKGQYSCKIINK